jgi:dipeptidyl aminopeptidase/acylaminoacyl peptidase
VYERRVDGSWKQELDTNAFPNIGRRLDISVQQNFVSPPVLLATDVESGHSRIIFDPNPELKDVELGQASIFKWKDRTGREWSGGLYKPADFIAGQRYPLVIQTHGFSEALFEPSGAYPTGFAARELAESGILVLQMRDCPIRMTTEEANCDVAGYEGAVEQLVADGEVDANRVGITGFSRTCYHVLSALTSSVFQFGAASITDGVNFGYLEYLADADAFHGGITREANAVIGVPPFGKGLEQWLTRSTGFNMDKVTAPLQVVANGQPTILEMWEPYAALRLQSKPVDLIVLRGGTHVLTSPAERLASQQGTVDWFRFWLQGYEDPVPSKASQYERWRRMQREMRCQKNN